MNNPRTTFRINSAEPTRPRRPLLVAVLFALLQSPLLAQPPQFAATVLQRYSSADAYQGIAVDAEYFYTINNRQISRHRKDSGTLVNRWNDAGNLAVPLIHLDSGVIVAGQLIAAHSNYPRWPMRSSLEFFDADSLTFSHRVDFGIMLGSMTWADYYDGQWWGAYANYDIVQVGMLRPYGGTRNTVVVRFDAQYNVQQQWRLPDEIVQRVSPMSNSGGSWGADGFLYLTGHDHPEIYVMQAPADADTLRWIATVIVPGLNGQGIAWDRSNNEHQLWAILRADRQVLKIQMPAIQLD